MLLRTTKRPSGPSGGNRLWELLRGPCPELLDALNQAMRRWRELQRSGAPADEVAEALARVIVLESEYARRCLTAGSPERAREEAYIRTLQDEYTRLIGGGPGGTPSGTGTPGTSAPASGTCNIKVTLDDVVYDGQDVGSDWRYTIVVEGKTTEVPEHDFSPNERERPNIVVFDAACGRCPGIAALLLTVDAIEVDISDDVGTASRLINVPCPGVQVEKLVARVREGDSVADLTFTFTIEATCTVPGAAPTIAP